MFLIDRLPNAPSLRADLAPRQLFSGAGDLIRATLTARPSQTAATPQLGRRPAVQRDLARPAPARRRKTG